MAFVANVLNRMRYWPHLDHRQPNADQPDDQADICRLYVLQQKRRPDPGTANAVVSFLSDRLNQSLPGLNALGGRQVGE